MSVSGIQPFQLTVLVRRCKLSEFVFRYPWQHLYVVIQYGGRKYEARIRDQTTTQTLKMEFIEGLNEMDIFVVKGNNTTSVGTGKFILDEGFIFAVEMVPLYTTSGRIIGDVILVVQSSEMDRNQPRRIPGSAGLYQVARDRVRSGVNQDVVRADFSSTQRFMAAAMEHDAHRAAEVDEDFVDNNVWTTALRFAGNNVHTTSLASINAHTLERIFRIEQVVAIIKECTPNGLGDMGVTLKDPTGTVWANIHKNVFDDEEWKVNIRVGSVIILKKVVVFCPTHSTRAIGITRPNVLKVIADDSPPLPMIAPTSPMPDSIDQAFEDSTLSLTNIEPQNLESLPSASSSLFNFTPDWTDDELNSTDFSQW